MSILVSLMVELSRGYIGPPLDPFHAKDSSYDRPLDPKVLPISPVPGVRSDERGRTSIFFSMADRGFFPRVRAPPHLRLSYFSSFLEASFFSFPRLITPAGLLKAPHRLYDLFTVHT